MVSEEIIRLEFDEAAKKFEKLIQPEKCDAGWMIKGSIDVIDDEGSYWDTYAVNIIIPKNYPEELPVLIEIGDKIERSDDWHNTTGVCCLSTNAKMFTILDGNITLLNWLKTFAHPFLANHVHKIKTGHYANKEFEHGTPGLIQGYYEIFKTSNENEVVTTLKFLCGVLKLGRNAMCFCESRKKYKRCFLIDPNSHYHKIPLYILNKDLNEIMNYLKLKNFKSKRQ